MRLLFTEESTISSDGTVQLERRTDIYEVHSGDLPPESLIEIGVRGLLQRLSAADQGEVVNRAVETQEVARRLIEQYVAASLVGDDLATRRLQHSLKLSEVGSRGAGVVSDPAQDRGARQRLLEGVAQYVCRHLGAEPVFYISLEAFMAQVHEQLESDPQRVAVAAQDLVLRLRDDLNVRLDDLCMADEFNWPLPDWADRTVDSDRAAQAAEAASTSTH